MPLLRNLLDWVLARDPVLSADDKLSRWSNLSTVVSVAVAVVTWVVGLLANIPWQVAVFAGLVTWVVLSNGALTLGKREVRKEESATANELAQLESKLTEVQQERDELRAKIEQLNGQSIQKLKERALDLSPKLFRFAQERDENAPPEATPQMSGGFWNTIMESAADPKTQERNKYDDETRRLYVERFGGGVGAVLDALQHREWLDTADRKGLEEELANPFTLVPPTQTIRQIAQRLDAAGKRL